MTREEAKNWLNKLYARADITDEYGDTEDMQPYEEAVNMAIKALEQEPIIDKIIAELEIDLSYICFDDWGNETTTWKEVKAIIDKYKEGEEE